MPIEINGNPYFTQNVYSETSQIFNTKKSKYLDKNIHWN